MKKLYFSKARFFLKKTESIGVYRQEMEAVRAKERREDNREEIQQAIQKFLENQNELRS